MKKILFASAISIFFLSQLAAQETSIPTIGSEAPSFKAMSTNGKISFPDDYGKNWKIMFSHPKDFTPVCSSEILELAYAQESFEKMGVKILVLSTDILEQHNSWKKALEDIQYKDRESVKINFPIVADNDMKVSKQYGMIHSAASMSQNIRGVYIINPDNVIMTILFYPNAVGRDIDEIKRTVVALQTNYSDNSVVTPANWRFGDDVLVPVLSQLDKDNLKGADSDYYQLSWFMTFKKTE
jgi:peroxiredoxin 2/4